MLQVSFDLLIFRAESRKDKNVKLGRQLELTGIRRYFCSLPRQAWESKAGLESQP
jgi:hypothetical protein